MLAHNLKQIFSIVPELKEHIKQANIEEDFPLDNKDSCLASYVRLHYLEKVAKKHVDYRIVEQVEKAATLYNLDEEAEPYLEKLTKYAQEVFNRNLAKAEELSVECAEALFEGNLSGSMDIEKVANEAKELVAKYGDKVKSEEVLRYSGKAYFDKSAAVAAIRARHYATNKDVYEKFAEVIERGLPESPDQSEVLNICEKVVGLDKKAGLHLKGFNPYKEFFLTKEAAIYSVLIVKVAGQSVPYEKIARLGNHRIGQYLGKEVAASLNNDPASNKAVIESLPMPDQRMLQRMLRSV